MLDAEQDIVSAISLVDRVAGISRAGPTLRSVGPAVRRAESSLCPARPRRTRPMVARIGPMVPVEFWRTALHEHQARSSHVLGRSHVLSRSHVLGGPVLHLPGGRSAGTVANGDRRGSRSARPHPARRAAGPSGPVRRGGRPPPATGIGTSRRAPGQDGVRRTVPDESGERSRPIRRTAGPGPAPTGHLRDRRGSGGSPGRPGESPWCPGGGPS